MPLPALTLLLAFMCFSLLQNSGLPFYAPSYTCGPRAKQLRRVATVFTGSLHLIRFYFAFDLHDASPSFKFGFFCPHKYTRKSPARLLRQRSREAEGTNQAAAAWSAAPAGEDRSSVLAPHV